MTELTIIKAPMVIKAGANHAPARSCGLRSSGPPVLRYPVFRRNDHWTNSSPAGKMLGLMLRTLHGYLTKELTKVTVLALVAFTLVMTVFAIIEPLRKMGLSAEQVLSLIGYTLPSMLSLTLPIAALFATTIVYGRFSQDNELLACKASGISAASLVKPALVLGVLATAVSLLASNYLTPRMALMGEKAIRSARGAIYQELLTKGHYDTGTIVVRAEAIDKENDVLQGVVFSDRKKKDGAVTVVAMSQVRLFFNEGADGKSYLTILPDNPVVMTARDQQVFREKSQPLEAIPLDNPMRDRMAFCDWKGLVAMLEQPVEHRKVKQSLLEIKQAIVFDGFLREVAAGVVLPEGYSRLRDQQFTYVIKAPHAVVENSKDEAKATLLLQGIENTSLAGTKATSEGHWRDVEVSVLQNGKPVQVIRASSGEVQIVRSQMLNASLVSIQLDDPEGVQVLQAGQEEEPSHSRKRWDVGQLAIPEDSAAIANISLADVYSDALAYTHNESILKKYKELKNKGINILEADVRAEMHGRVAYSLSCFLLVALGAALGLIFRGGQIVSAFALSVIPAAIVIVMILMGKELVGNPGVQARFGMGMGLAVMWSGIVTLVVANVIIYLKLVRK